MIYKTRNNSSSGGYVESSKKIANIQSYFILTYSIGCKKKRSNTRIISRGCGQMHYTLLVHKCFKKLVSGEILT